MRADLEHVLERVRATLVEAARNAYDDASLQGLCSDGAREAAISAMRRFDLQQALGDLTPTRSTEGRTSVGPGGVPAARRERPGTATFRVRHAQATDAENWAALRHALWPQESADELTAETQAFFKGEVSLLRAVLLAESDGGLLGFAELSLRPYAEDCSTSPVGFLEGWYVIPSARRQGVGRALVAAAETWAREQGCREFASDTQLDNTGSAAAHYALGFEDAGVIRCFRKAL